MSTATAQSPGRRWAMSLRAMMLAILIPALALVWENHRRQRVAVDGLLAVLPTGILLEVGPSHPWKDPTHEPDRGRYLTEIHQVTGRRAESLAVRDLATSLRTAREWKDWKTMRGSLAALQWLGPRSRVALTEVIKTARGDELPASLGQHATQVRTLAIHLLGLLAAEDDHALAALIAILKAPDVTDQGTVSSSAANELGGLGPRASGAVPVLIESLDVPETAGGRDHLRYSAIVALGRLGPEAGSAVPRLAEISGDRNDVSRRAAVESLGEIGVGLKARGKASIRGSGGPTGANRSLVLIDGCLKGLLEDGDPAVREEAKTQSRRLTTTGMARRR